MNDDIIQDLKQFISATISQQTSDIIDRIDKVENKVDDLSDSVAEALENTNEATDAQLKDFENRIYSLEQKAT
jgi:uncharacterized protein (UPF0335 family)